MLNEAPQPDPETPTNQLTRRAAAPRRRWRRRDLGQLADIEPMHVTAYIEALGKDFEKPTVKQRLPTIRMLLNWLVTGQVVATNTAHAVRGPKHVVKTGKTTVLDPSGKSSAGQHKHDEPPRVPGPHERRRRQGQAEPRTSSPSVSP